MIILVTGQPGNGKTAHVVDMLAFDGQYCNRPIFSMGIPELKIEHTPCPPVEEWTEQRADPDDPNLILPYFTFPENAIVVIDEAQRVFRPRTVGSKVPDAVQAFETHRHTGIDLILITQNAGLIDANIRKLIGKHIHIRSTFFGRYRHEWPELGDPDSITSRNISAKTAYRLPKRAFELYKSSTQHIKPARTIPVYFWIMLVALIALVGLGIYGYQRANKILGPEPAKKGDKAEIIQTSTPPPGQQPDTKHKPFKEWADEQKPRAEGFAHTAPKYDHLTEPVDAPWISGCYVFRGKCSCLDQQGNRYQTTDNICRTYMTDGIFKDWESRKSKGGGGEAQPTPVALATKRKT